MKDKIVSIAKANQLRQDNVLEVYAQIDPLVKQLTTLVPSKPEAEQVKLVAGGWRNLWSDMLFPPTVDLAQNYQVVSPKGYYYNVSRQVIGDNTLGTGYLRGQYKDAGDHLDIEFTRNAFAPGWPAVGTKLLDLGEQVEGGSLTSFDVPGPIGVTGTLKNAYVDNDLRIITGGDSTGESGLIFVMTKSDTIAP